MTDRQQFTGQKFTWQKSAQKSALAISLGIAGMIAPMTLRTIAQTPADPLPTFPLPESLPSGTTVKLDGSTSMQVMNDLFKQKFEQKFAGSGINLATSNSDDAVKALLDDKIDVAALGRPLTEDEKAQGLQPAVLAREKIAIVVGADNPFSGNITFAQFAKIFRGEITDWSELGGAPGPIKLIDRPENSDTRRSLSRYPVFQEAPFQAGSTAQAVGDDTAAVTAALGQDGIGYAVASQALNNPAVKIISMHKTLPDDPRYPYSQPRNYVYKAGPDGAPSPAAAAFLGYATSPDGQAIVQEAEAAVMGGKSAAAAASTAPATSEPPTTAVPAGTVATAPAAASSNGLQHTGFPDWWWLPIAGVLGAGGLLWWASQRKGPAAPVGGTAAVREPVGAGVGVRGNTPTGGATIGGAAGAAGLGAAAAAGLGAAAAKTGGTKTGATNAVPTAKPIASVPVAPAAKVPATVPLGLAGVAAAGAAAVGAGALVKQATRLSLKPVGHQSIYASWDIPDADRARLKQQGGETLQLKLHDVTGIDLDKQPAHAVEVFDCDESKGDKLIPLSRANRDYVAELGYKTRDQGWLSLAKSKAVKFSTGAGLAAGVAGAASVAAIGAQANVTTKKYPETSHIMLNRPTNTYVLDAAQVEQLTQQAAVKQTLQPGHYTLKITEGQFSYYPLAEHPGEPLVMLWFKGGKLIGDRANIATQDTWLTLNGYGDEYKVQILEPTTLYGFFIDTNKSDNAGEVTVKITKDAA
jgi:phosphate transport system substrate-binding protein